MSKDVKVGQQVTITNRLSGSQKSATVVEVIPYKDISGASQSRVVTRDVAGGPNITDTANKHMSIDDD